MSEHNLKITASAAKSADIEIGTVSVGKTRNKLLRERQKQVLEALQPMEHKLFCLCDKEGKASLQHLLPPAIQT